MQVAIENVACDENRLTGHDAEGEYYTVYGKLHDHPGHLGRFDGVVTEGPQLFSTRACTVLITDTTGTLFLTDKVAKDTRALFKRLKVRV